MAATHACPEAGWDPAAQPSALMLGVLSGDVRLAVRALRDYAQALGFEFVTPQSRVSADQASAAPGTSAAASVVASLQACMLLMLPHKCKCPQQSML